ncbi:pimeloyl-ACP methyl ester carboxylesterase [Promicromonospora sp. AC04]|uniref:alpha/beta fold hydrolase n=1 Tax=Promicromonospora sp. AC04 TaxID=2135723 RepID=UPI000D37686C|nr:alpha/beta hydrolase [Promicromonospora sp. AC04]PUB25606.1 pimeloyl-ACP methyl ester carboxylesterase [Promicromonospora sp. AC04]
MDIILIPGFWLNGSAWDGVVPSLEGAGHTVHALTLPGLESVDADRSGIHLSDHVAAVVAAIDAVPEPAEVVLVGHSAGGGLAYAASGLRPERVARVLYVDSGPLAEGQAIDASLAADVVDHRLPPWEKFEDEDLVDLTDELRAQFRARAVPQPGATVREGHHHPGVAQRGIPGTVIACEFPGAMMRQLMEQDHPYVAELKTLADYEIVDLPTGHWPMFTKPKELAEVMIAAVAPAR